MTCARLGPAEDQEIRRRYETGEKTLALAAAYGCHPYTIVSAIKRAGGSIRRKGSRLFTTAQIRRICDRYLAGESLNLLAKEFGCSLESIKTALKQCNVQIRSLAEACLLHSRQCRQNDWSPTQRIAQLSAEQAAEACQLYEQGLSTRTICKLLGVKYHPLRLALSEAGVMRSKAESAILGGQIQARFTEAEAMELRRRHEAGELCVELAREHGCGVDCVMNAIRRVGGRTLSHLEVSEKMRRDVTGQTFGRLTGVRCLDYKIWGGHSYVWEWQCACGALVELSLSSVVSLNTQSCGCIATGESSLSTLINGEFYEADRDAEFYVYSMANYPGLVKPGIDSTGRRKIGSRGEYGEKLLSIEGSRADVYLLEQAVLTETRLLAFCPQELFDKRWPGATEVRRMDADHLIRIASELQEMLLEMGRWEFALQFVPMTEQQREQVESLAA